jgi:hypothetical protein
MRFGRVGGDCRCISGSDPTGRSVGQTRVRSRLVSLEAWELVGFDGCMGRVGGVGAAGMVEDVPGFLMLEGRTGRGADRWMLARYESGAEGQDRDTPG